MPQTMNNIMLVLNYKKNFNKIVVKKFNSSKNVPIWETFIQCSFYVTKSSKFLNYGTFEHDIIILLNILGILLRIFPRQA